MKSGRSSRHPKTNKVQGERVEEEEEGEEEEV
jgi:hypothetical protein